MIRIIKSIQGLRAIAALAVLLAHATQIEDRFLTDPLLPAQGFYGVSGVDLFFVISGFVMVHVTGGVDGAGHKRLGAFLYARATRIYPPYWLFTLFAIAAYALQPTEANRSLDDVNLIGSILLWPTAQLPVLSVGWTLIHEMYFYLVFTLVLAAPRRWLPALMLVWFALISLGTGLGASNAGPVIALITHPMTAEFILGALIGFFIQPLSQRTPAMLAWSALVLGLVGFIVGSAHYGLQLPADDALVVLPDLGWGRVIFWGLPSALILYGAVCLELSGRLTVPGWMMTLGDWSYALYLCHLLVVTSLGVLWARIAPDLGWFDNLVLIAAMFAASLLVAALAYYGVERPVLKLTKKLGRRRQD